MLLKDVVECKLNHHLTESCVTFRFLNSLRSPNDVDYLCRVTFFVSLFTHDTKRKRDSKSFLLRVVLLLLLLRNGFRLKGVHYLMVGHIDEYLSACLHILRLDDEAFLRLDHRAALAVHLWFAICTSLGGLLCRHLVKQFLDLWGAVTRLNLLVNVHELCVSVSCRWSLIDAHTATSVSLASIRVEARGLLGSVTIKAHRSASLLDLSKKLVH